MSGISQSGPSTERPFSFRRVLGLNNPASSGRNSTPGHYPGSSIHTTFVAEAQSGNVPKLLVNHSISHARETEKSKANDKAFFKFAHEAIDRTKARMLETWELDKRRTCQQDLKKQALAFEAELEKELEGTGIEQSTNYWADPKNDNLCRCQNSVVTGEDLQFEDLAIITRCDGKGVPIASHFHSMTPMSIATDTDRPFAHTPRPLSKFTHLQVATRTGYLSQFHSTLKGRIDEYSKQKSRWTTKSPSNRNETVLDTMRQDPDYFKLAHIFQGPEIYGDPARWDSFVEQGRLFWPVKFINQEDAQSGEQPDPALGPEIWTATRDWIEASTMADDDDLETGAKGS